MAIMQAFLSLSDLISVIPFMVGTRVVGNTDVCTFMGILTQYTMNASSCWSFLIAAYCYLTIIYNSKVAESYWWWYNAHGWGTPLVATGAMFIAQDIMQRGNVIGDATYECWISSAYQELRMALLYVMLWLHFFAILFIYTVIFFLIQQRSRELSDTQNYVSDPIPQRAPLSPTMHMNHSPISHVPVDTSQGHDMKSVYFPHQIPDFHQYSLDRDASKHENATLSITISHRSTVTVPAERMKNSKNRLIVKTFIISVGFLVSWVPATINRVMGLLAYRVPYSLVVMAGAGLALSGFPNAIAFYLGRVWDAYEDRMARRKSSLLVST
ncbi:hypothetical protein BCR33DRAFT_851054 [Rhizoclosmatium globosum]|uniref:G-protein coupled receptors family 2 profile 2 domain-containing protein n=1 Tax=Rhizoclosmatium globosum TaxID=329046 RepID=A0A1Y2C8D6_9FUNG|nr:hypothetical protein BCR33DRAFT_851054 [Rhizoclosmatium globosum]|eukprot:ORY43288.1 hypothetical protein BCR33DRAFT_851054 [Rhizoclosmatium globosum]